MAKRKKTKNPDSFEKKSRYNENRDHYVDSNGNYVYTTLVKVGKDKWQRKVLATIPMTPENREVIILLDQSDHDTDLQDRYAEENTDPKFRMKQENYFDDEEEDFDDDPVDQLPDRAADIFSKICPEPVVENPDVKKAEEFVATELLPQQQELYYSRFGELRKVEDIRQDEIDLTGREVTKQAFNNRWNKIIKKACRYFDAPMPKKQTHKKSDKCED